MSESSHRDGPDLTSILSSQDGSIDDTEVYLLTAETHVEDPKEWPTKDKWLQVVLVACIALATPLGSAMYTPALDQIVHDLHLAGNEGLAHLSVSAYVFGFATGPLLVSPLSEVFGRRPVYIAGTVLLVLGNLGCAIASSIWWLVAFRFMAGCAGASPIVQGSGTVADLMEKEQRGRALSAIAFGSVCGPVLGPIIGGKVAQVTGWRACFVLLVAVGCINVVLGFLFLRETSIKALRGRLEASTAPLSTLLLEAAARPFTLILQPSIFFAIVIGSFFYSLQVWLYVDLPSTYKSAYGLSTAEAGMAFASIGLGMAGGLVVFGGLSDVIAIKLARGGVRLPQHRLPLLMIAVIMVSGGMACYVGAQDAKLPLVFPLLGNWLTGMGLFAVSMSIAVYLVDVAPQHAVASSTTLALVRFSSGAIFPPLFTVLGSVTSYEFCRWLLIFLSISTIPILVWLQKNGP